MFAFACFLDYEKLPQIVCNELNWITDINLLNATKVAFIHSGLTLCCQRQHLLVVGPEEF